MIWKDIERYGLVYSLATEHLNRTDIMETTIKNTKKVVNNVERIISVIKERIFRWEYPPNHPLGEDVLCKDFGVSRSPVREALRSLEAEGLVHRVNNRGFFVRQFKSGEISELYLVRQALELFAVEHLAIHKITHDAVAGLANMWREIQAGVEPITSEKLARIDEHFHEQLVALTGNSMLLNHLRQINARLLVFREMDFAIVMERDAIRESCESHLEVVRAILEGDPLAAREALRGNLQMGLGNVNKAMGMILAKIFDA
jgi:DNA-binding GntR family transcriptional regulator